MDTNTALVYWVCEKSSTHHVLLADAPRFWNKFSDSETWPSQKVLIELTIATFNEFQMSIIAGFLDFLKFRIASLVYPKPCARCFQQRNSYHCYRRRNSIYHFFSKPSQAEKMTSKRHSWNAPIFIPWKEVPFSEKKQSFPKMKICREVCPGQIDCNNDTITAKIMHWAIDRRINFSYLISV